MSLLEQLIALLITAIVLVSAVGIYRSTLVGRSYQVELREAYDTVRHIVSLAEDDIALAFFSNESNCSMVTESIALNSEEQQLFALCTTANPLAAQVSVVQQVRYIARYLGSGKKDSFLLVRQSRFHRTRQEQVWKEIVLADGVTEFSVKKDEALGVATLAVSRSEPLQIVAGGSAVFSYTFSPQRKVAGSGAI